MSNYNSQLQSNNTDLQEVLELLQTKVAGENLDEEISTQTALISEQDAKIAELIEKVKNKASVTYPTLSNPATAENLQEGYELIDGSGNVVIGTHVCSGGSSNIDTCTLSIKGYFGFSFCEVVGENIIGRYHEGNINLEEISVPCSSLIVVYDYLLMSGVTDPTQINNVSVVYSGADFSTPMRIFQVSATAGSNCILHFE